MLDVKRLHADGYGVSADGASAVFGALPGERVLAEPFTKRKRQVFHRTIDVEKASPDRVTPICSAAHICGGCSLQHLDPSAQLARKQNSLLEVLDECVPQRLLPPLVGPVSRYRSKARLGVKYVTAKGRALVGFREKLSPFIAEIETCEVLSDPLSEMIPAISGLIDSMAARARIPQIEVAAAGGIAALVLRHLDALLPPDLARLEAFARTNPVHIYLQPGGPETVTRFFPKAGEERLYYALPKYDLTLAFHPLDFTQVNQVINRDMIDLAIELLALAPADRVADLFCGIGNFSLPLARKAVRVMGIEGSAVAVQRARENARRNEISNCDFVTGDLFAKSLELALDGVNKVLIDPPRSGAAAVCETLANHKVERVVYVSCNPMTLARDTKTLVQSGYRLEAAGVIDMFPHTSHVESIACFVG